MTKRMTDERLAQLKAKRAKYSTRGWFVDLADKLLQAMEIEREHVTKLEEKLRIARCGEVSVRDASQANGYLYDQLLIEHKKLVAENKFLKDVQKLVLGDYTLEEFIALEQE